MELLMKYITGTVCFYSLLFFMCVCAYSEDGVKRSLNNPASERTGSLNVKDFGAKGDGKTDDTESVQRCLLEAGSSKYPRFYRGHTAAPEVYFPEGIYCISNTLLVPSCGGKDGVLSFINLRGDGAVIRQASSEKDIMYIRYAYRNLIEGLTFEGGRRQIKIWSKNHDKAHIIIRDCVFRNSTGAAIDDQLRVPFSYDSHFIEGIVEPYSIKTGESGLPLLTAVDEEPYKIAGYVSTTMRISRCSFENCMQALSIWADWSLVDDCVIETNPEMSGPAILTGGTLMLEKIRGLGHGAPGKKQWWITIDQRKNIRPSWGNISLDMKQVSLKTDSAAGWTVVRNEAKNSVPNVVIFADDCVFQGTGSDNYGILHLVEIPNLIMIRNCRELNGGNCNLFSYEKQFPKEYFGKANPESFAYVLDDNNIGIKPNVTDMMKPFVKAALPGKINQLFVEGIADETSTATLTEIRKGIKRSINLANFGAKGDGIADDTEAFRLALTDAASAAGLTELIVPNGIYRLGETLKLPERIVIRGSGYVAITTSYGWKGPVFISSEPQILLLQNLNFTKCEQAVSILSRPDQNPKLVIDNCAFNETADFAVKCQAGYGDAGEPNQAKLRISDCTFEYCRMLWSNFKYVLVENAWVTTDPDMKNTGAIVNKGGFHFKTLQGVPQTTMKWKTPGGKDSTDTKSTDMRWVNNYYHVQFDRCRFGGEDGGLPAVVNLTSRGTVLFNNTYLNMAQKKPGNTARNTFIDCEKIPEFIAVRGAWGYETTMLMVPNGMKESLPGHFFESGNTIPVKIEEK